MADSAFLPFIIQHRRTCCFVRHLRTAKSGRQMFKWLAGYWPEKVARFASVDEAKQYIADARIAGPLVIQQHREGGRYA
jgi:ribosomal protein L22